MTINVVAGDGAKGRVTARQPGNRLGIVGGLVLVCWGMACAHAPASRGASDATWARLTALTSVSAGERPVWVLDINGDGRIDTVDVEAFERLSAQARQAATNQEIGLLPRETLYHGPAEDAAPVFSLLVPHSDGVSLDKVPASRLVELAVEARWLARQAALLAHAGVELDGANSPDAPVVAGLLRERLPGYNSDSMAPGAVCAAIESMPLGSMFPAELGVSAIFDLDSTVWAGNVMDPFLGAVVQAGLPKPAANAALQELLKSTSGIDPVAVANNDARANAQLLLQRYADPGREAAERISDKDMFYMIAALLADSTVEEVEAVARKAYTEGGGPYGAWQEQLFVDPESGCGMRRLIEVLQNKGVEVYLLSATHDPVALAAAAILGVPRERILGSLLEVQDGKYTGQVSGSTYYTKGSITRQWLSAPPFFAFGDSPYSDFSMLQESVGPAFMINPRPYFLERDTNEAGGRLVQVEFPAVEKDVRSVAEEHSSAP